MNTHQTAYACVRMPDGRELKCEVVVFDAANRPLCHFPLTSETAFTEWRTDTYYYPAL